MPGLIIELIVGISNIPKVYSQSILTNQKYMFGNLMNQMQEQQKVVKEKLAQLRVQESSDDGIIQMVFSGEHELLDLKIDWDKTDDKEMIEDLLIATFNKANTKIAAAAGEITASSLSGMLPPGLSNIL